MKTLCWLSLFLITLFHSLTAQNEIKLLVRADDIGSSHNANLACIESYKNGIVKSVEIMVPCSWFPEAVELLNENPGLDVGIHLVLNSEWDNYKWRPLTNAKSITDPDGFFFPMVWPNENYVENRTLVHSKWNIAEVEAELRAQIELAMKKIPTISHLSNHMGWTSVSPEFKNLYEKLAKEYNLEVDLSEVKSTGRYYKNEPGNSSVQNFINMLEKLEPGTYLYVEHPGLNVPEAQAIFHTGYENVASERQTVTDIFTHPDVEKAITQKKIQLVSYNDLKK
jgi:predicted glycoside hydrolase/deacetylase ChbG (UPF0249 family)